MICVLIEKLCAYTMSCQTIDILFVILFLQEGKSNIGDRDRGSLQISNGEAIAMSSQPLNNLISTSDPSETITSTKPLVPKGGGSGEATIPRTMRKVEESERQDADDNLPVVTQVERATPTDASTTTLSSTPTPKSTHVQIAIPTTLPAATIKGIDYSYHRGTYQKNYYGIAFFDKWSCCSVRGPNASGCVSTNTLLTKQKANRLVQAEDFSKAIELYKKVLEIDPNDNDARLSAATIKEVFCDSSKNRNRYE